MTEVTTINPLRVSVPAESHSGNSATAQTDQQRAIAEVQAAMMIARANPRNEIVATDRILNACARPSLADAAVYTYAKGGSNVSGPSIRLAEVMVQQWGNMMIGTRELDQANGKSTVQTYAWDLETNIRQEMTFQVPHLRYTRKGSYRLEDPREIYELVANQGARRRRACILAVIPTDVAEAAVAQCEATMCAKADTSPDAMQKMLTAFEKLGVTKKQIEKRIQRRLDAIQPAQVVSLKKIYASLRDGMSTPADWFEAAEAEATSKATTASRTDAVKAKAQAQREAARKKSEADQQDDALRPLEQGGQQQSFGVTFTQVSEQLHKASDIDLLDAAADLIGEVEDSAHREELSCIYRQRRAELEQA